MITAKELRIGNILEYRFEEAAKWVKIKINSSDIEWCEYAAEGFNKVHRPVVLTPEILERAGGKYEKIEGSASLDYSDKDGTTEYWYYKQFGGITIVRWDNGPFILSNSFSFNLRVELKHLHHFQNVVFALCGTEIDINL
jgi:hypothetical protein